MEPLGPNLKCDSDADWTTLRLAQVRAARRKALAETDAHALDPVASRDVFSSNK
jgi:hypothetical protein